MCGIFAYLLSRHKSVQFPVQKRRLLQQAFVQCQHRGPDNSIFRTVNSHLCLGFHRLSIVGMSDKGNQPMCLAEYPSLYLVCNGEIYNYKELARENNFTLNTGSDCEIILHMYRRFGIEQTVSRLDGVFAFVLYDGEKQLLQVARDPFGVRSLYRGRCDNDDVMFASEIKSLQSIALDIEPFPPGYYGTYTMEGLEKMTRYYLYDYSELMFSVGDMNEEELITENIRKLLMTAVEKRLMSERPVGCMLSGGLDSSLVTALVAQHFPRKTLHTYSIGLEGSEDLKFARLVADHVGTIHHEIVVSEKEMLDALEEDVWTIETYDTTTVRASTPMLLMCKYIKRTSDITVIYSGEGSDEASGSYLYFHNAPSPEEFQKECVRLLVDLHRFDVLRCDKSTSGAGLEVRVPFLDKNFLQYYMSIPAKYKIPRKGMEKYLLRKSFDGTGLLPKEVLWRQKEGFSDGCSSKTRSWYQIIQEHVEKIITDKEFETAKLTYTHNPPMFKEAYYYRKLFSKYYEGRDKVIPYYWLPKWSGDIVEPSARVLTMYEQPEGGSGAGSGSGDDSVDEILLEL